MRINISAWQGFITFHWENAIIIRSFAWALNCGIGVAISRDNFVLLKILVGVCHQTSATTAISLSSRAVKQLLLR
jgi:hypothetical protein